VRRNMADPRTAARVNAEELGRHRRATSRVRTLVGGRRAGLAPAASRGYATGRPLPPDRGNQRKKHARMIAAAAVATALAIALVIGLYGRFAGGKSAPRNYLGVYTAGLPESYAGVSAFTAATGVSPGLVMYYSGWHERFQEGFARQAARHGAMPLVQMEPTGVSLPAIAAGGYDRYLRSYAASVKAFGSQVILSFGHEMNGPWYPWGYRHTPPKVFVAAWRHIVTVFRQQGADNVTWLWTVNIIQCRCHMEPPALWWPGRSYVNWVGIDGYYYQPSGKFAALFGPTIKEIRRLTLDPILISETAAPAASQAVKIADLFAGVRAYGLLGFVWFDHNKSEAWRISSPAAIAAFHRGAEALKRLRP
jgi:mannan endo-1,4-beta-mannosidase